ncbi:reverse transcriptase [Elysia marginata]|uniref:Reverse transcriptase n=1 Tax=Elysia marginata TaxID=1093978 RepID=A0AAV4GZ57_9GAST|nr:reverse transcriptase [Elysia marginata]
MPGGISKKKNQQTLGLHKAAWFHQSCLRSTLMIAQALTLTHQFADDTTLQGLITNDEETQYREEINKFVTWCDDNYLTLNVSKTKELKIDFRRSKSQKDP